jgi:hypothetical protein
MSSVVLGVLGLGCDVGAGDFVAMSASAGGECRMRRWWADVGERCGAKMGGVVVIRRHSIG